MQALQAHEDLAQLKAQSQLLILQFGRLPMRALR